MYILSALKLMFSVLKTFHFTQCFAIFFSAENINSFTRAGLKIMTFMDNKPTESVGYFEENKFSVVCRQFLLD